MDGDHCRALGAYSGPDFEIVLDDCQITSAGASALAEILGRNQGPTELNCCYIDNVVLANGLRGNIRLPTFKPFLFGSDEDRDRQVLAIAGALRENKGLVDLDLRHDFRVNDETWGAICDPLETHPTFEVLYFRSSFMNYAPAVIKSRIQAILDMMKVNTSIQTIHLPDLYCEHELFRGSVVPYLETNRFRPSLLAIKKTCPITYRAKVLGRALVSARTDANSFRILLSGNAEVAFPSRTTAAAVNLPTPATTAATSTTHVAAFTGLVTTASTTDLPTAAATLANATSATTPSTASDAFPFAPTIAAAANIATPCSGHKRKGRP
jgi:hypothetical protein